MGDIQMSKHEIPVIEIKLEKHPGADALSLVRIDGYVVVIKTADWKDGDLAAYIAPDYVVPNTEQFAFLNGHLRIKPHKFRGIISEGLLIKLPQDAKVGDEMMERLGITRYEPPMEMSFYGDNEKGPPGTYPKYDVESYKKYHTLIASGEEVVITEKLHGASARYLFLNGRMWVGSRSHWKKQNDKDPWWKALSQNAWIEGWAVQHEGYCLYGEIFGQVQNLKYGCATNEIRFAAFDILYKNEWLDYTEARKISPQYLWCWVPEIYRGPFDKEKSLQMAEEDSSINGASHYREGVVVQPILNRWSPEIGRVKLKIVGNRYFQKE
jgi:RNA ligase (TIGR02306 family)